MSADLITPTAVLIELERHIGAEAGISANGLAKAIAGLSVKLSTERAIRKVIEQLRRDGHHICGDPGHGYFLAQSEDELLGTCKVLYERAMTSLVQVAAMRRVALPDIAGQLRLPT